MDFETMKVGLQALNMAGTIALWLWLRIERRNDKTNETVAELAAKVVNLDKDISSLKASSDSAPNHGDLSEMYKSLNNLSDKVNQLIGQNNGQNDLLRLIMAQITERGMR